jgi:hypothetical protein
MVKGIMRLTIPNPNHGEIDWSLVKRTLQMAQISPDEWENG